MNPRPELLLVFDVESVGLYGEGFAVGGVVVRRSNGEELDRWLYHCPMNAAQGTWQDRAWCERHIVIDEPTTAQTPKEVRAQMWAKLAQYKSADIAVFADVPFPVEANFLLTAAGENNQAQPLEIYPLLDVATMLLADAVDPLRSQRRQPDEKPKHNPLADARQSARLLVRTLKRLDKR